jgi:hypothetical protein
MNMHAGRFFSACKKCRQSFYAYELDRSGRCRLCRLRRNISFYAWLSADGGEALFVVGSILVIVGLLISMMIVKVGT